MSERFEEALDELRQLAGECRAAAEYVTYGYAPGGGDPRDFSPDPECCTEAEITAHAAACAAWERGERPVTPGPHDPLVNGEGKEVGHITRSYFGIGTYTLVDEQQADLADRLERILSRLENP